VAGLGEFLGYTLRSISGYVADRTGRYWPITFAGYTINLLAVPAMALAGRWETAAAFLILERVGRAFRKPTVEAMLSYSAGTLGRGWVYGLNTALDETGATLGPLLIAFALHRGATYRAGYSWLIVSSLCALAALTAARVSFPVPSKLEEAPKRAAPSRFTPRFWISMVGAACFGSGLMSFELISFHLAGPGHLSPRPRAGRPGPRHGRGDRREPGPRAAVRSRGAAGRSSPRWPRPRCSRRSCSSEGAGRSSSGWRSGGSGTPCRIRS
jgi:hypothetical protein